MRHFTIIRALPIAVVCMTTAAIKPALANKPASQPTTQKAQHSMKGWELYAWKEGESWQFSLLEGTNREKEDGEISDKKQRLADVAAVKARLADLAPEDWVTLQPRNHADELPPDQLQKELKAFCEEHKLHWQ